MKTKLLYKGVLFLVFSFAIFSVRAQEKDINVKSVLEGKNFVFMAQSASPTAMPMRQLTGDSYNLRLSGDTLVSYLPYFGRAYSAPSPGASGGYSFTSTEFDYTTKARRKGGWDVVIKPKDVNDVREFSLNVSKSGYATLRALSNNRQLITYNGFLVSTGK
jgi:hypothetical protein